MPNRRASLSQAELTRYAKAMRAAGYEDWRIEVANTDGTKVSIRPGKAGETADDGDDIDAMIERLP